MLGHVFKEHGNGVHAPVALVFKDLRAIWSMCPGGRPSQGRGHGRGTGRGGSRSGRGAYDHDENMFIDDFDAGSREAADDEMNDGELNRKRAMLGGGANVAGYIEGSSQTSNSNTVGALVNQFQPPAAFSLVPHSLPPKRDLKRVKTTSSEEVGSENANKSSASAGSLAKRR